MNKLEKMLHNGGKETALYKVHGLADQNLAGYDITKTGNGIHGIAGHGKYTTPIRPKFQTLIIVWKHLACHRMFSVHF